MIQYLMLFSCPLNLGCPPCSSLVRLCLKEYQSSMPSVPGVLSGCSFGNASTQVLGGSSFVLTEPELGSVVLPFSFRWTVSTPQNIFLLIHCFPSSSPSSTSIPIPFWWVTIWIIRLREYGPTYIHRGMCVKARITIPRWRSSALVSNQGERW